MHHRDVAGHDEGLVAELERWVERERRRGRVGKKTSRREPRNKDELTVVSEDDASSPGRPAATLGCARSNSASRVRLAAGTGHVAPRDSGRQLGEDYFPFNGCGFEVAGMSGVQG